MKIKKPKQRAQITRRPDPKTAPKANEVSQLHRTVFACLGWNPTRTKEGATAALTPTELAHLRTNTVLKHISFRLLFLHRLHSLKSKLNSYVSKKG